jgi:hypothetical protein
MWRPESESTMPEISPTFSAYVASSKACAHSHPRRSQTECGYQDKAKNKCTTRTLAHATLPRTFCI